MRRFAALAVLFASPLIAAAQTPALSAGPTANPGPFQVPGQTVGQYQLKPVGSEVSRVGTPGGKPVGTAPGGVSSIADTSTQIPGFKFDPKNVVGPVPGSMKLPTEPSAWEKFVEKFGATFGLTQPQPKAPNWTPGISRRNRERAEERSQVWRRD